MSLADHRSVLNHVLGGDQLRMGLLRQDERFNTHCGLWSVWWLNGGEVGGAKVVLATTPRTSSQKSVETIPLEQLPWVVLQLQILTPDDPVWASVYRVLRDSMEARSGEPVPCQGRIHYNARQVQSNLDRREMVDPDLLQDYTVVRVDDDGTSNGGPRPANTPNRRRIPYRVYRGRPDDTRVQPMQVFIERPVPKRAPLGQQMRPDTGLTRTSTLLSAVNDWHTWIILTEGHA